jgi:hypothetical protein
MALLGITQFCSNPGNNVGLSEPSRFRNQEKIALSPQIGGLDARHRYAVYHFGDGN